MLVRKESTKKQQKYEVKPNLGKNYAIDFRMLKFLPLSERLHRGIGRKLLQWWINYCKELKLKERRIGSATTELCSQKEVSIENAQSRYSDRTVTLIEHSPKML